MGSMREEEGDGWVASFFMYMVRAQTTWVVSHTWRQPTPESSHMSCHARCVLSNEGMPSISHLTAHRVWCRLVRASKGESSPGRRRRAKVCMYIGHSRVYVREDIRECVYGWGGVGWV